MVYDGMVNVRYESSLFCESQVRGRNVQPLILIYCAPILSTFKLIFQRAPIGLIFGQIGYWDDTRQCVLNSFNFSIIIVITILVLSVRNWFITPSKMEFVLE